MKILFLTNNEIAYPLIEWLIEVAKEDVVVCQEKISKHFPYLNSFNWIISYSYKFILKNDVLELFPNRIINLHISYLPWNKGADPNFWSFVENTPKGVTIHYINGGIDTGHIITQKEVFFTDSKETLASSYEKLQNELRALFINNWDKIKNQKIASYPQKHDGITHYVKDFIAVKHILGHKGWSIPVLELIENYNRIKK